MAGISAGLPGPTPDRNHPVLPILTHSTPKMQMIAHMAAAGVTPVVETDSSFARQIMREGGRLL